MSTLVSYPDRAQGYGESLARKISPELYPLHCEWLWGRLYIKIDKDARYATISKAPAPYERGA